MVQHILLMFVAAPLLALSAPITLLLRAADGRTRTRILLPILHSRFLKVLAFPVVSWAIFAGVMWGSHFSPLFDAALEDPLVHDLEHLLFLGAAILFWWPALAVDPVPWRMPYPARIAYLFLQMPQNTFLSVAIYGASAPLYAHYATLQRPWGPTPLEDQALAGGLMWAGGDLVFLIGAHDGLPPAWRPRADLLVSLSAMTFPHELARAMREQGADEVLFLNERDEIRFDLPVPVNVKLHGWDFPDNFGECLDRNIDAWVPTEAAREKHNQPVILALAGAREE